MNEERPLPVIRIASEQLPGNSVGDHADPAPLPPRSRSYWRVFWLVPALAMLGVGLYYQYNVPEGGEVSAIKLSTKQGLVGQASEAFSIIKPGQPDLYIKVFTASGDDQTFEPFKDTPLGNGLTWTLPNPKSMKDILRIEVWDKKLIFSDKELDRLTINNWNVDGQQYHIDLLGKKNAPQKWAMPVAVAGGVWAFFVLLRFVWDQVI